MIEVTENTVEQMRNTEGSKRYVKKPIVIEAFQMKDEFYVDTLEGKMKGNQGDYLLIGVKGEMYPCNKEIFEETYDQLQ
jgi:hypothetical protein